MERSKAQGRLPSRATALVAGLLIAGFCLIPAGSPEARAAQSRTPATAEGQAAPGDEALQRWVEDTAAAAWSGQLADPGGGSGVRFEVRLGQLNPGLKLAPCARVEPFLPANTRLWGRAFIGVRCAEGARWTTMLPVTVAVFGPALVANLPVAMGTLARLEDFRIEEVDLTRSQGQPVSDPALLEGRAIGRPLAAGQVLRATDLRTPQTVSAGDPVRIRLLGQGFAITTEGFAMAGAGNGQTLRVRTQGGKVLVGTVRERSVEVRL